MSYQWDFSRSYAENEAAMQQASMGQPAAPAAPAATPAPAPAPQGILASAIQTQAGQLKPLDAAQSYGQSPAGLLGSAQPIPTPKVPVGAQSSYDQLYAGDPRYTKDEWGTYRDQAGNAMMDMTGAQPGQVATMNNGILAGINFNGGGYANPSQGVSNATDTTAAGWTPPAAAPAPSRPDTSGFVIGGSAATAGATKPLQIGGSSSAGSGGSSGGSAGSPGATGSVANRGVDYGTETIEGRIKNLLGTDANGNYTNPVIQQAANTALQQFAGRGLLNSSMATEAAYQAAMSKAIEIAGPDAQTYFSQGRANQDAANVFERDARGYAQENYRLDRQLSVDMDKFNRELQYRYDALKIDKATQDDARALAQKYALEMENVKSVNSAYDLYLRRISDIDANPEYSAEVKAKMKNEAGKDFDVYAKAKGIAWDMRLADRFTTSAPAPSPAPAPAPAPAGNPTL